MEKEIFTINGKDYEATYLGESDITSWSDTFSKRKYWRLENIGSDFKKCPALNNVLPYNNYPPTNFEIGQVFAIDYYKSNVPSKREYYIVDGTVWRDMPCTREFVPELKLDKIIISGKEYAAAYFGEQDMSSWSKYATKREFWRLENCDDAFKNCEKTNSVLPYNNYPLLQIEIGQVFVIDYHTWKGTIDRKYYIADGTFWQDMPSTQEFIISE